MGGPAYIDGKKYKEFDNFYVAPFKADGQIWPTVEHAFQASKSKDPEFKKKILSVISPKKAWELGQAVQLREDWETIKFYVMQDMVFRKISQNIDLIDLLLKTKGDIVSKHSSPYWNDANSKILTICRNYYDCEAWYSDRADMKVSKDKS